MLPPFLIINFTTHTKKYPLWNYNYNFTSSVKKNSNIHPELKRCSKIKLIWNRAINKQTCSQLDESMQTCKEVIPIFSTWLNKVTNFQQNLSINREHFLSTTKFLCCFFFVYSCVYIYIYVEIQMDSEYEGRKRAYVGLSTVGPLSANWIGPTLVNLDCMITVLNGWDLFKYGWDASDGDRWIENIWVPDKE